MTNAGSIQITAPVQLTQVAAGNSLTFYWPVGITDVILESTPRLGPTAQWNWVTNAVSSGPGTVTVTANGSGNGYFRLRRPW